MTEFKNKYSENDALSKNDIKKIAKQIYSLSEKTGANQNVYIAKLFNMLGFKFFQTSTLPEHISGVLSIDDDHIHTYHTAKLVVLSDKIKEWKSRFVLAHELGHYLFDFYFKSASKVTSTYSNNYKNNSHGNSKEEINASTFAAELLIPSKKFNKEYYKLIYTFDQATAIQKLSETFMVTPKTIRKRIKETLEDKQWVL